MLGRPASCEPVWMKVMAGSWLIASVCIDLTMQQMSSTTWPVCGNSSLSHAPLWPCWANLNIDGATGKLFWPEVMPVSRWPMRIESGSSVPFLSRRPGLWSNRSSCDGAPDWNR